jgi:hypothetical protein
MVIIFYPVAARARRTDDNTLTTCESDALYKNGPMIVQSGSIYDDATYNYFSRGGVLFLSAVVFYQQFTEPCHEVEPIERCVSSIY